MRVEALREAIVEAERFIKVARKVKIETIEGKGTNKGRSWDVVRDYTPESASCKRASMDLSRSLSALRKS